MPPPPPRHRARCTCSGWCTACLAWSCRTNATRSAATWSLTRTGRVVSSSTRCCSKSCTSLAVRHTPPKAATRQAAPKATT
eukprot:1900339-Prymnesium_polylepis.1